MKKQLSQWHHAFIIVSYSLGVTYRETSIGQVHQSNHCVLINPSCRFCSSLGRMSRSMRRLIVALGSVCRTFSQIHDRFVPSVDPTAVISGTAKGRCVFSDDRQTTSLAEPVRMLLRCAEVLAAMLLLRQKKSASAILILSINRRIPWQYRITHKPLTELDIRQFRMARYEAFALAVRAVAFERRVDAFAAWIVG